MSRDDLLYLFPQSKPIKEHGTKVPLEDLDDPLEELLNEFSDVYEFEELDESLSREVGELDQEIIREIKEFQSAESNIYHKIELIHKLQQKSKFLLRELKIFTS